MDEYLSAILSRIGDPIFVKDNDHRMLMVNKAFCEMFGMQEEEVLGKTLAEHVPEEERKHFLGVDRAVLDTGQASQIEESLSLDGQLPRYIITKKYRFVNSKGEKYLIGIIHDITYRREAELLLEGQRAELAELIEHKDQILSVLSHDLRAPINSIIGMVEVLQLEEEFAASNATCQTAMRQIREAAHTARDMMENLLEWAVESRTRNDLKTVEVDMDQLIINVLKGLQVHADDKQILMIFEPQHLPVIHSDPRALGIVLRNLVQNAIKFTDRGGRVHVSLEDEEDVTRVSVKDNGVGMDEVTKATLLASSINQSRLGTSKEKGAGLGVALCNDFVSALGGEMTVESTLGEGSLFSFTIPKRSPSK